MRRRRVPTSNTDPKRPPRDLRTTNRQDSTDAPAMVASSVSRHQEINFFGPQEVSHRSLWTSSELNDTQTAAWLGCVRLQKPLKTGFSAATFGDFGAITQTFVAGYAGQTLRGSAERSASKSASSTPPACSKWLQLQKPFSASLLHPYRRSSSSTLSSPGHHLQTRGGTPRQPRRHRRAKRHRLKYTYARAATASRTAAVRHCGDSKL